MFIPVYQPELSGNEKKYVNDCLDSNWISAKGKYVPMFESRVAEFLGVRHAISVSNGTVALHLALMALGIGEGDEVIVPALTYVASANAVVYTGAVPVFADSLYESWQIDPEDVERKITDKTRAIMVVHVYGQPCDMDRIMDIAKRHDLFVIEDCAEAFGSTYKGKKVGGFGDIAAFSFYGNKTITTGEGGMVVTNDTVLSARAAHMKDQGLAFDREYWHDIVGYNYRMTNICAAIGSAQMENVEEIIERKKNLAKMYTKYLKDVPVELPPIVPDTENTYWMVSILLPDPKDREPLRTLLNENGIETRPMFYPCHLMPMYSKKYHRLKVSEDLGLRGINLPSWPGLTEEQVKMICDLIAGFYQK
jgi:perosamine synthetase